MTATLTELHIDPYTPHHDPDKLDGLAAVLREANRAGTPTPTVIGECYREPMWLFDSYDDVLACHDFGLFTLCDTRVRTFDRHRIHHCLAYVNEQVAGFPWTLYVAWPLVMPVSAPVAGLMLVGGQA